MEKKLQKFGINMGQRYKYFVKKKNISRNIMEFEKKYKSTRNKIRIISPYVKHKEKIFADRDSTSVFQIYNQ